MTEALKGLNSEAANQKVTEHITALTQQVEKNNEEIKEAEKVLKDKWFPSLSEWSGRLEYLRLSQKYLNAEIEGANSALSDHIRQLEKETEAEKKQQNKRMK